MPRAAREGKGRGTLETKLSPCPMAQEMAHVETQLQTCNFWPQCSIEPVLTLTGAVLTLTGGKYLCWL